MSLISKSARVLARHRVHEVIQVTKLDTVFDIVDDEAVAVRSFRQSAGATG